MCRSIVRLRDGADIHPPENIEAAARQFVRKVTGFSRPAAHNQQVFEQAVTEIAESAERLMNGLEVKGAR